MNDIIVKTYELIDVLDNSELIKNISYYKEKISNNKNILDNIKKYREVTSNDDKIYYKKLLYSNIDYKGYIDNYNKLNLIIRKINNRYDELLKNRECL